MADSNPVIKVCTKCNNVLPLESFYVNRANKDGRQGPCKACVARAMVLRYEQNREILKERSLAWYHNNKGRARSNNRRWKEQHRDHINRYDRERHKANPGRKRARQRKYAQNNADRIKARQKARHKNLYRERPVKPRLATAARNAKKWQASGICSENQWLAKVEFHGWRCIYCNSPLTWPTMHIDHRKPLARGGSHWPANLAPACQRCNLRKSWRTDTEFVKLIGKKGPPTALTVQLEEAIHY